MYLALKKSCSVHIAQNSWKHQKLDNKVQNSKSAKEGYTGGLTIVCRIVKTGCLKPLMYMFLHTAVEKR